MTTILIIEDEPELREELVESLTFEGFETLAATNGREGVEVAVAHNPDLILSDITMPEMDGYEALSALQDRSETAHIPVIFLSARVDRSFVRHGMELGADDYLTKPFTTAELLSAISARLMRQNKRETQLTETLDTARKNLVRRVVHEMRSPLISLNTMQEIFSRQFDQLSQDQIQEYLSIQREGSQRLTHLVDQMVYLTELESESITLDTVRENRRSATVYDLINVALDTARKFSHSRANHPVKFTSKENRIAINCEVRLIKHALAELISNALLHSDSELPVEISYWAEDKFCLVSILDHGQGIAPNMLDKILSQEHYYQFDDMSGQGMGFGLPLSRRLIDMHGGMLIVNSQEGKGTQVVIKLPIH